MEKRNIISIKITRKGLRLLQMLCAETGKKRYDILEEILQAELDKVSAK